MSPFRTTLAAVALLIPAAAAQAQQPEATAAESLATAVFAGGCFWCMEPPYDKLPGVVDTTSGYIGGELAAPSYEQVSSGGTGHYEAVRVTYDPARVSYAELLEVYWPNVDPLDAGGQFCDRGPQYKAAVFVATPEQRELAARSKRAVEDLLGRPVTTEILPAAEFWPAEDYHQDYYEKNPVRYKFYRWNCGRDARLAEVWDGKPALALAE